MLFITVGSHNVILYKFNNYLYSKINSQKDFIAALDENKLNFLPKDEWEIELLYRLKHYDRDELEGLSVRH